jgi:predicted regulator of Ras-like GTPase activity (Roadblock/LC7/MglB family)
MPPGAASWSFTEDDFQAITVALQRFLYDSNARCALLVDRAGQLVATVGEAPAFDATAFASLTAADFSANDQLAKLIGERDFTTLFHQGEKESMYLADVARRVILVVLFDDRTTLGLVRLKLRGIVEELSRRFEAVFARSAAAVPGAAPSPFVPPPVPPRPGVVPGYAPLHPAPGDLLAGAEDEIDRLFS